ncbi:MAG: hypothetical protein R3C25_06425 [Hyphomonadaceae bacterium]
MIGPPIPQRIPPLAWRGPAWLWTPLALAVAIGWPALIFYDDAAPQRLALTALFAVFAIALVTLGLSWAIGRAPKARRIVVLHVVIAGVIVAALAPFLLTWVLSIVTPQEAAAGARLSAALVLTPLVFVLGLPVALISGIAFAWIALEQTGAIGGGDVLEDGVFHHDVQPFQ